MEESSEFRSISPEFLMALSVPFSGSPWDPSRAALTTCAAGIERETERLGLRTQHQIFQFASLLGNEKGLLQ